MANGILVRRLKGCSTDVEFIPLQSRSELSDPALNARLHALASDPTAALFCGCGVDHGVNVSLSLRRCRGSSDEDDHRRIVVRDTVKDHKSGCFLCRNGDDEDIRRIRAASLFGRVRSRPDPSDSDHTKSEFLTWTRDVYDTWSRYARGLISKAHFAAFGTTNRALADWSRFRNPEGIQFFRHLGQEIRGLKLSNGIDGFEAARSQGAEIRFGLTFEAPPRPDQRGSIPWTVEWWNGSCLECWNSRFDDTWAGEVSGASTVFGREIEPPFLVIAIVEPDGTYRRIFLHAVYFDGSYIVPVDSGFERAMVARLIKAGVAFLKPVHMADYLSLPPIFHVPALTSKKWPYRPDFLVFLRTPRNINELCIVEVRGFKVGTHCTYDLEWAEKKVWYESLRQIGAVRFEARNGWELEPVDQRAVLDITEFPHRFGGYTQTFDVGVLDGR